MSLPLDPSIASMCTAPCGCECWDCSPAVDRAGQWYCMACDTDLPAAWAVRSLAPLDASIDAMCTAADLLGAPVPQRFIDVRLAAASAAIFVALFALASRAYAASPEQERFVRHLAISEGVVKPPKRATREQRVLDEATRWGLNRKAVGL